ncbi:MAG: arylsulfatase [Sandarakinorhabdus sp.]|nr:arylsulfatase [Sandarakinorhabdus sp.]
MTRRNATPSPQGGGKKLALLAALLLTTAAAPPIRPNIVILLADDWGFTDVGAFGGEIATPNIDSLAATGVRFSNFHVAGSCAPTRAMLQTGVSSHRAGLGNMPETIPPAHRGKPGYDAVLNDRVISVAQRLRAAGYRTYLTGKWHLGHTPATLPTGRGYDHAFALSQSGADNFEDKPNLLLYRRADWTEDAKPADLPANFYSSRVVIDKMIAYIDGGDQSKPFLASVNFLANHIPVQAPDADIAAYRGRYDAGWTALRESRRIAAIAKGVMPANMPMVTMRSTPDWATQFPAERRQRSGAMAAYGAMATAMDREIGRLVAHLKTTSQYDNTIFVFLSDNGAEATDPMATPFPRANALLYYDQRLERQGRPGSLTAIGAGFASAASSPLRGYKFTASEGGLRVPMIIAWPGNPAVAKGAIASGFAHVTDIAPTLLQAAGAAPTIPRAQAPMTGHSLMPMLVGGALNVRVPNEPLGYELAGNAVLWKGDLKLVKNLPPYGDGQWHLFDIVRDPGETIDLATARAGDFQAMQVDYAAYAKGEQVLDMPTGYSAPQQIIDNAMYDLLWPRLRAMVGWATVLLALIGGGIWRLKRK